MQYEMKFNIDDIRDRAQGVAPGAVAPEEVEFARDILRSRSGTISAALYVVGLCGEKPDAELVKGFIFGEENDVWAEVALKALCRYLGLTAEYRPLLRKLVMSSDIEGDTRRMAAIHLMSEYFDGYRDDDLGCHLVKILCDGKDRHRSSARDALARILNLRGSLVDPYGLDFDDWDEDAVLLVNGGREKFGCGEIRVLPIAAH